MNSLIRILLLSIIPLGLSGQIKESFVKGNRIPVGVEGDAIIKFVRIIKL